jgi:colanic acid/amylovoran biosynthesis protein
MNILLLNVGVKNKGNQALVESTKMIIRSYIPDARFMDMGPEISPHILLQPAIKPLRSPYPWLYLVECCWIRLLRKCGLNKKVSQNSRLKSFDDADLIINSGGDVLSGEKFVGSSFFNLIYGILLGKPIVLFAESLGYYKNPVNRIVAKYVFNHVGLILVREVLSKKYLLDLGIGEEKIFVTSDPAFLLERAPRSRIDEIFALENIPKFSRPLVGINLSSWVGQFRDDPKNGEREYIALMVEVINYVIETKNADILLIPHVYADGNDDRDIIRKIAKLVPEKAGVYQITQEYTAAELKGIIGCCDMFIGARMHATIAATSQSIPTIGIAYSHKMKGIIGDALGLSQYIIEINKLDAKKLILMIDDVFSNRKSISGYLDTKIPGIQEKAMQNGYYLKIFLENGMKNSGKSQ